MTFSYSRCTKGLSFHPDLLVPVRAAFWKSLRSQGYTWAGITAFETGWHYGRYGFESGVFAEPVKPKYCGVTSWIEAANIAGLRTVTRGNYSAQMLLTGLADLTYLEEPILKHAEVVGFAGQIGGLFSAKPWEMNAFQPVGEWPIEDTPENCQKIHAFYQYMTPKIRAVIPNHTLVFSGPNFGHLPRGKWGMPPMVDPNGAWAFDTYLPYDDPARIPITYQMLGSEKMLVLESGLQDRSDLTHEEETVQAYQARALPLKIPIAGWLDGVG